MNADCQKCKYSVHEMCIYRCMELGYPNCFASTITHYDVIRALSAEDLATWIETISDCDLCPIRENCSGGDRISRGTCRLKWLAWLQQEETA